MMFAKCESRVCQVDLIDLENGSRAPGRFDKAAQESAQNAADTMQAGAQTLQNPHGTSLDSTASFTCGSLNRAALDISCKTALQAACIAWLKTPLRLRAQLQVYWSSQLSVWGCRQRRRQPRKGPT